MTLPSRFHTAVAAVLPLALALALALTAGCSKGKTGGNTAADSTAAAAHGATAAADTAGAAALKGHGASIDMRLKFKKGQVFGYSIVTAQNVKTTQDSLVSRSKQTIRYDYEFKVLKALPDGGARLQATCRRVVFDGNYQTPKGEKKMHYDSGEKNDRDKNKEFAQYNATVHTPFELVLNGEAKVTEVDKVDGVVKNLMSDDYKTAKLTTKQAVAKDYSEHALKDVIQLAFQKVENRPVKVDSSWKLVWSGKMGYMDIRNTATYTLTGYEDTPQGRIAHIRANLLSEYLGERKLDTGQGTATVDSFKVGGNGETTFNVDTGKPVTRRMKQTLYVKFFIEPPAELKQQAPDQAHDFWMIQDAQIENTITPLPL